MLRNILRNGVKAVSNNQQPNGPNSVEGKPIATYGADTFLTMPPANSLAEDARLLRETGWDVAKRYIKVPPVATLPGWGKHATLHSPRVRYQPTNSSNREAGILVDNQGDHYCIVSLR